MTKAAKTEKEADTESDKDADKKAADKVAALIDAIYVQERNDKTDAAVCRSEGSMGCTDRCPERISRGRKC